MTLLKSGIVLFVYEFYTMQGCRNYKTELEGIAICTISGTVKTDFAKENDLSPTYHHSFPEGLMKYG